MRVLGRFAMASAVALTAGGAMTPVQMVSAQTAPTPDAVVKSPADIFGPLFRAVQQDHVFADGKTFVDAVPKRAADAIMADFARTKPDGTALKAFVLANFVVPGENDRSAFDLRTHVRMLWPQLVRQPATPRAGSSALPLPARYVVPGGRFREIYYWDSYFTMLGLKVDGQQPLVEAMLDNFTSLIERYGHIPNGTRTYYLSRSQPPYYALMLDLSSSTDPVLARRRLAALRTEHAFWMKGTTCLAGKAACLRVVRMPDGSVLNRYYDDRATPRDESFAEDVETATKAAPRPATETQRDLRAGAESGWDFSSRWLRDPASLATIHTTDMVPVDLNSLLWAMESRIAERCRTAGDAPCATAFTTLAAKRKTAIDRYLWQTSNARYADWDLSTRKPSPSVNAAMLHPLFVGLASPAQARSVAATVRRSLVAEGGLRTTTLKTGQQWDEPNGWAPLQWVAIAGLDANGEPALAKDIARRWIGTVGAAYAETGKMLEKYNIEQRTPGGGGEYPVQDGFGWTNGVTSAILDTYPDLAPQ
ncbi:MAG TPA: alpha,alpha-trehalase TreF [Sphingomonas sp.]|nr:alpha,alpha-trehalase TreF [Sphingomonas sp.]